MSEPYNITRLITERDELENRANELTYFIGLSTLFDELSPSQQEILKEQNERLWQLYEVLNKRIQLFQT